MHTRQKPSCFTHTHTRRVPDGVRGYLAYVMGHLGDSQTLPLMEAAVEARTELAPALPGNKELLYLDLALEDQARQAAERGVGSAGMDVCWCVGGDFVHCAVV